MKICPNCGFSNKDESEYCEACGAKLLSEKETVGINKYPVNKNSNTVKVKKENESGFTPIFGNRLRFNCPKCGQPIDEKYKKCPNCGFEIRVKDDRLSDEVVHYDEDGRVHITTKREILIGSIIFIVIFIISIIISLVILL